MIARLDTDQQEAVNRLVQEHGAENLSIVEPKQRQQYIQLLIHVWDSDKTSYRLRALFNVPLGTHPAQVQALAQAVERYIEQTLMHI